MLLIDTHWNGLKCLTIQSHLQATTTWKVTSSKLRCLEFVVLQNLQEKLLTPHEGVRFTTHLDVLKLMSWCKPNLLLRCGCHSYMCALILVIYCAYFSYWDLNESTVCREIYVSPSIPQAVSVDGFSYVISECRLFSTAVSPNQMNGQRREFRRWFFSRQGKQKIYVMPSETQGIHSNGW